MLKNNAKNKFLFCLLLISTFFTTNNKLSCKFVEPAKETSQFDEKKAGCNQPAFESF